MTSNLLYKELRLAAHPNLFVFALLGVLVIVPAYPYGMVFIFGCLAPYITFTYGRETNDITYTALLPVKKRDIVKGKFLLVALAQAVSLLISLPFAFLRVMLLPGGNPAGMQANVAFYGFGLMAYALFNLIFMTAFFKTAYKAGRAFLLAMMPITLLIITMEVLAHIPPLQWMDSVAAGDLLLQLPILLVGMAAYGVGTAAAYRVSARRFERVDL